MFGEVFELRIVLLSARLEIQEVGKSGGKGVVSFGLVWFNGWPRFGAA